MFVLIYIYHYNGSDHVLKLMKRHYKLQEYKDLITSLRSRIKIYQLQPILLLVSSRN